jgi:hypothetical protein
MAVHTIKYGCPHHSVWLSIPFSMAVHIIQYGCPHFSVWLSTPFRMAVHIIRYGCPHHSAWLSTPFSMAVHTIQYGCPHHSVWLSTPFCHNTVSYRDSAQAGQRVGRYSREVGPSGNLWNSGKMIVFMLMPVLRFVKILYVVLTAENDGF